MYPLFIFCNINREIVFSWKFRFRGSGKGLEIFTVASVEFSNGKKFLTKKAGQFSTFFYFVYDSDKYECK